MNCKFKVSCEDIKDDIFEQVNRINSLSKNNILSNVYIYYFFSAISDKEKKNLLLQSEIIIEILDNKFYFVKKLKKK